MRRLNKRRNPFNEDALALADVIASSAGDPGEALDEIKGSAAHLPRAQREVLALAAKTFPGGEAFSRAELAREVAGQFRGVRGKVSFATGSIEASKALTALERAALVVSLGSRLDRGGKPGPEHFVLTERGEHAALGARLAAADAFARDAVDREIAKIESGDDTSFDFGANVRRESRPRTRTVVDAHAAKREPCRLCRIVHSLKAHRSHRVDGARRKVSLVGSAMEAPPVAKNPKKKRGCKPCSKKSKKAHGKNPATLADNLETWARAKGLKVPARGSPAWKGLFTAWERTGFKKNPVLAEMTLAGLANPRKRRKKSKALPPGFKMIPAPHGLHGWYLVPPGRSKHDGILVSSSHDGLKKAWTLAKQFKTNPNKKRRKPSAKKKARKPRRSVVKAKTVTTTTRTTKFTNPGGRRRPFVKGDTALIAYLVKRDDGKALPVGTEVRVEAVRHFGPSGKEVKTPTDKGLSRFLVQDLTTTGGSGRSWWVYEDALERPASKANPGRKRRKKNPSAAGVLAKHKLGDLVCWKDLPDSVKRDPVARNAALRAARRHGIPLDELKGEVVDAPDGSSRHLISSGELVGFQYRAPRDSRLARTRRGTPIVWDHESGDHGRGQKKTKKLLLTTDPRNDRPVLVKRRGSRPGFSADRGHTG